MRKLNYERDHFRQSFVPVWLQHRLQQAATLLRGCRQKNSRAAEHLLLLVLATVPLLMTLLQQTPAQPEEFLFRDETGQVRLRIGMTTSSSGDQVPAVAFYASDGQTEIMTLAAGNSGPEVCLVGDSGEIRLASQATPGLAVLDQQGRSRVTVSTSSQGGMVNLCDENGRPRVCLADGAREVSGLVIGDRAGVARAGVFVNATGPVVLLKDADSHPRLSMRLSPTGGQINTFNQPENGQPAARLEQMSQTPVAQRNESPNP